MLEKLQRAAAPIGRVLLSGIFLMSGIGKIPAWNQYAARMENEGMVAVPLFLAAAILFEVLGGLSVLLGLWARLGAAALLVFLVPTTLIFHDFWTYVDPGERQAQMMHFVKNLAIMGGLLMVVAQGAGCCSLTGGRNTRPPD